MLHSNLDSARPGCQHWFCEPGGMALIHSSKQPRSAAVSPPVQRVPERPRARAIPAIVDDVLAASGTPLDSAARELSSRFAGYDFSRARVHTDPRAADSVRAVNALAYTVGDHMVFGAGQYQPQTAAGRRLLAHEMTHVVQQSAGASRAFAPRRISAPGDAAEQEADRVADAVLAGPLLAPLRLAASPGAVLQRQSAGDEPAQQPPAPAQPQPQPAQPQQPPAQATPQPSATAQVPSTSTAGTASSGATAAGPASAWNFAIPYIHFDLLDFHASQYYSAYVGLSRNDNPNFANQSPLPVRTPANTRTPGGWPVIGGMLDWTFYNKFYIDSAAAPFPGVPSQLAATADIRYVTTNGTVLFDEHFADPSPRYLPPLGTHPYDLRTTPFWFRNAHQISEDGLLSWDASLTISTGQPNPGYRVEVAPTSMPGCLDEAAIMANVRRSVSRVREAATGEPAWVYRVSATSSGPQVEGRMDVIRPDGQPGGNRVFRSSCRALSEAFGLVISLAADWESPSLNNQGTRTITGSQRVPFRAPPATP